MSQNNSYPIDFGAVYYRRSAPAESDWERDYQRAAEDGITMFRHWFVWGAIETAPGVYNWEPYDRQVELGQKYGIKTVIAEMSTLAPEWFYAQHPEARSVNKQGQPRWNSMNDSSMAGGNNAICMDHPETRKAVASFLSALGEHYKDMPGVYGYDIWNECSLYSPEQICYCPETEREFQEWLRKKYGTLEALGKSWRRYSYTDWSQIRLPRMNGPHPEFFDAIRFQNDNQEKWLTFRIDTLRKADPNHKMIAHGNAKAHSDIATCCGDDWRYSKNVDIFGYTLWYANNCHTMMGGDMIRSASNGKEFWRAEAVGDGTWEHRSDKTGYQAMKDEMSVPENIRLDAMMSLATGASAYINPRYRPLVDGHLFHAYGWYAPDGSRTDRSKMVADLAKWSREETCSKLWKARPMNGEVGILLLEDAQALCYSLYNDTDIYAECLKGAYQAFLDSGIQSDIIRMDQIQKYDVIYVPYPVGISDKDAETLKTWIQKGGTLISEGCFGYFNDSGHAMEYQLNRGFDEVFGCVQSKVHLGPDRNKDIVIHSDRGSVKGGVYQQSYQATSGQVTGFYEDGSAASVKNHYGKGMALLVGSMPGYGYFHTPDESTRRWYASLLAEAGKAPRAVMPYNTNVTARFWQDNNAVFLWLLNFAEYPQRLQVNLAEKIENGEMRRGQQCSVLGTHTLSVTIDGRDAAVIQIK